MNIKLRDDQVSDLLKDLITEGYTIPDHSNYQEKLRIQLECSEEVFFYNEELKLKCAVYAEENYIYSNHIGLGDNDER